MKKIFALAAIALFTITSCSDDSSSSTDNNNGDTSGVLPTKIVVTADGQTITSLFTYNGRKLTNISNSDGTNEVITYTGDFITSWKKFEGTTIVEEYNYTYDAITNNLKRETHTNHDTNSTDQTDFVHNQDGTISFNNVGIVSGKYTANSITLGDEQSPYIVNYVVTYDGKNNPYKNITGLSKIYFWKYGYSTNFSQNVLTETRVISIDPVDDLLDSFTYTYNDLNYPVSEVIRDHESNDVITSTTQYFY